ncbi:RTA1 like protein-domain-containing protein [Rhizoctonia solani]|nr:RTA1 like protein-domain-containing protein [Rhizoctonia solani]
MTMIPTRTLLLSVLFNALYALAKEESSTDAKVPFNPLHYTPSKPPAAIAGILYLAIAAVSIFWCRKRWARYMLTIIIGSICYAIGLLMRIPFAGNPTGFGLYIIMNLLTVLSPCAFIATISWIIAYMLLGRLAMHLDADEYLLVKSTKITKLFVTSDIVTLLIQATGGGMSASASMGNLGSKIFLVGLTIQLISFVLYMIVCAVFLHRMMTNRPEACVFPRNKTEFFSHWTVLAGSTIENAQGWDGYLATHEGYFYVLDTLPLFIAVLVFVITWPPMYLTRYGHVNSVDTVETGMSRKGQR